MIFLCIDLGVTLLVNELNLNWFGKKARGSWFR